jgi:hypothetical protein
MRGEGEGFRNAERPRRRMPPFLGEQTWGCRRRAGAVNSNAEMGRQPGAFLKSSASSYAGTGVPVKDRPILIRAIFRSRKGGGSGEMGAELPRRHPLKIMVAVDDGAAELEHGEEG